MNDIPRDRWGRSLIHPANDPDGKPVPYQRASSIGKVLDDEAALSKWKQRMTALGLVRRPDLHALVSTADPDDRSAIDRLCQQALDAAAADARANLGTALHELTEMADRGYTVEAIPALAGDLAAYQTTLEAHHVTVVPGHIEDFVAVDRWQIAGTFDRLVSIPNVGTLIADLKTGARLDYSWGSHAMQLAAYAHGERYAIDHQGDPVRQPLPDHRTDLGLIIHLPAGEGRCDLYLVDLEAGAEAIEHALWVKDWRKRSRSLSTPLSSWQPDTTRHLQRRIEQLYEAGITPTQLAEHWPAGVAGPKRSDEWTTDQHDLIARALDRTEWDSPTFTDPPPKPPPDPKPLLELQVQDDGPDEGPDVEWDDAKTLVAHINNLPNRHSVDLIVKDCAANDAPISLGQRRSKRRFEIARMLLMAARADVLDFGGGDPTIRSLIAEYAGNDAALHPDTPIGRLVGRLTAAQAKQIADELQPAAAANTNTNHQQEATTP